MATEGRWYARTVFFCRDVGASAAHYVDVFGFAEKWRHEFEGRVVAAQVERADCEIILNYDEERAGTGRLFLSLDHGQSRAIGDEIEAAGGDVSTGHWGMPVIILRDPDGNELFSYDDELGPSD